MKWPKYPCRLLPIIACRQCRYIFNAYCRHPHIQEQEESGRLLWNMGDPIPLWCPLQPTDERLTKKGIITPEDHREVLEKLGPAFDELGF